MINLTKIKFESVEDVKKQVDELYSKSIFSSIEEVKTEFKKLHTIVKKIKRDRGKLLNRLLFLIEDFQAQEKKANDLMKDDRDVGWVILGILSILVVGASILLNIFF